MTCATCWVERSRKLAWPWTTLSIVPPRRLGALAAVLGGIDGVVFTAGIGENSAEIRQRICTASAWLGIALDESANAAGGPRISTRASRVSAWVIPTNEEAMIARHMSQLLGWR